MSHVPSKILFFDIETNGIDDFSTLEGLEVCHCMSVYDPKIDAMKSFTNSNMEEGLNLLGSADYICGHNVIGFDIPALFKLFKFNHPRILDTLIMARCIYPDLRNDDFKRENFEPKLFGSHSLKAWGHRIGSHKGDFGETTDWSQWSKEMQEYCEQDVFVTFDLYKYLMETNPSQQMLKLEHDFALYMRQQEWDGFPFDLAKAEELAKTLVVRRLTLEEELQVAFPPTIIETKSFNWQDADGKQFPTKKAMVESGYKPKDCFRGERKTKSIPFNPASRDQIAFRLMEKGWEPAAYDGKRPKIDEGVLKQIGTPEAEQLLEYLLLTKRLGQLAEGANAWLKLVKNGVIHGQVNTNGAVSGRCTHNRPNLAQVPSVRSILGNECRELFTAPEGSVLVGCDASGLELRCLASYLAHYDNGEYAKIVLEGDVHTANQKAAGLETRDQAKTFGYALIYGAGDAKLGAIAGGSMQQGRRLRQNFFDAIPAFKRLLSDVEDTVDNKGYLKGLDGRKLPCRSKHSALNVLLQSAGAVIMKQALIEFVGSACKPFKLHGNIHDEVQFSCAPEHADELGQCFVDAIKQAGKTLDFLCELDGEFKVGNNWKETH